MILNTNTNISLINEHSRMGFFDNEKRLLVLRPDHVRKHIPIHMKYKLVAYYIPLWEVILYKVSLFCSKTARSTRLTSGQYLRSNSWYLLWIARHQYRNSPKLVVGVVDEWKRYSFYHFYGSSRECATDNSIKRSPVLKCKCCLHCYILIQQIW